MAEKIRQYVAIDAKSFTPAWNARSAISIR